MDTEKMILGKADAILTLELGANDDMLNEVEGVTSFFIFLTDHDQPALAQP
jgi:hypothetical protein